MSTTTKKYQIIQKLENGNTLVLHPETDAGVVKVDNANYNAANLSEALTEIYENTETIITDVAGCVKYTDKGKSNGVASLDSNGRVPSSQLPSYVDDVLEYEDRPHFPSVGEAGKIYVDKFANLTYRWSGSTYVEISPSLALGETASTAYAGNKGKLLETAVVSMQTDIGVNSSQIVGIKAGTTAVGKAKALDHTIGFYIDSSDGTLSASDDTFDSSQSEFHIDLGLAVSGVTAGTYSCVSVDQYGRATLGAQIIEVGTTGQTAPSSTLAIGGIFFKEI